MSYLMIVSGTVCNRDCCPPNFMESDFTLSLTATDGPLCTAGCFAICEG